MISFLAAVAYLETAGGAREHVALSKDAGVWGVLGEVKLRITAAAGSPERKKAFFLFVMILAALGLTVLDESRPLYARAYSWFK